MGYRTLYRSKESPQHLMIVDHETGRWCHYFGHDDTDAIMAELLENHDSLSMDVLLRGAWNLVRDHIGAIPEELQVSEGL